MTFDKLLEQRGQTRRQFSIESGIPYNTINDIFSGKAKFLDCKVGTAYKIAKGLNVTVDYLYEFDQSNRGSFEDFKNSVYTQIAEMGDVEFVNKMIEDDRISTYLQQGWNKEAMYLLGTLDYLSRVNHLPRCSKYDKFRKYKLKKRVWPESIINECTNKGNDKPKEKALKKAIPEFLTYGIVEDNIRPAS